jgi:hypothetical protein
MAICSTLADKSGDYSNDSDRLWNFNQAAQFLGKTPEQALYGMMLKHVVSVTDIIFGHKKSYSREYLDEKLGDWINYLILLEAVLVDRLNQKTD